jgi:hypothetical protein
MVAKITNKPTKEKKREKEVAIYWKIILVEVFIDRKG